MKFNIEVTETCSANYVVEANSKEEAQHLFDEWVDKHQEWVSDDLMDCCYGWAYSEPMPVQTDCEPDITYKSLEE